MIPATVVPTLYASAHAIRLEKALKELADAGLGTDPERIAQAALAVRSEADDLASAASSVFDAANRVRCAEADAARAGLRVVR